MEEFNGKNTQQYQDPQYEYSQSDYEYYHNDEPVYATDHKNTDPSGIGKKSLKLGIVAMAIFLGSWGLGSIPAVILGLIGLFPGIKCLKQGFNVKALIGVILCGCAILFSVVAFCITALYFSVFMIGLLGSKFFGGEAYYAIMLAI